MALCYSILIPFAKKNATIWHPTEAVGPFSTLTRGAFSSFEEAQAWAKENIPGHKFSTIARPDLLAPAAPTPGPDLTDHPEMW